MRIPKRPLYFYRCWDGAEHESETSRFCPRGSTGAETTTEIKGVRLLWGGVGVEGDIFGLMVRTDEEAGDRTNVGGSPASSTTPKEGAPTPVLDRRPPGM